jgi:hypothetical protein
MLVFIFLFLFHAVNQIIINEKEKIDRIMKEKENAMLE